MRAEQSVVASIIIRSSLRGEKAAKKANFMNCPMKKLLLECAAAEECGGGRKKKFGLESFRCVPLALPARPLLPCALCFSWQHMRKLLIEDLY